MIKPVSASIVLAVACLPCVGQTITLTHTTNDGGDDLVSVQNAINAAAPKSIIMFPAGTTNLNGSVVFRGDITYTCSSPESAVLWSVVPKDAALGQQNKRCHAWTAAVQNIVGAKFKNLMFVSNNGLFWMDGSKDMEWRKCTFTWGYDGSYYNRIALRAYGYNENFVSEDNRYVNSLNSDRAHDLWNVGGRVSWNLFDRVHDGGHSDGRHHGFEVRGNYFTNLRRMSWEAQDHGCTLANPGGAFTYAENIIASKWQQFWDGMHVSVPLQFSHNVVIEKNFLDGRINNGGPGQKDSSGVLRGSYFIEDAGLSGYCRWNTYGGIGIAGIVTCGKNRPIYENYAFKGDKRSTAISYGDSFEWYGGAAVGGEPSGHGGNGTWVDLGRPNTNRPLSEMPPTPPRATTGPVVPIPPIPPTTLPTLNFTAESWYSFSTLTWQITREPGVLTIMRRTRGTDWENIGTLPDGVNKMDVKVPPDPPDISENKWEFGFKALKGTSESSEVWTQVGLRPDPTVPPLPPEDAGTIVITETELDKHGNVVKTKAHSVPATQPQR
jgi:hypothetical protein